MYDGFKYERDHGYMGDFDSIMETSEEGLTI